MILPHFCANKANKWYVHVWIHSCGLGKRGCPKFKYLGKFFITDRKLYREYCQTGTVLAVMWVLCQTAMVKRELSRR